MHVRTYAGLPLECGTSSAWIVSHFSVKIDTVNPPLTTKMKGRSARIRGSQIITQQEGRVLMHAYYQRGPTIGVPSTYVRVRETTLHRGSLNTVHQYRWACTPAYKQGSKAAEGRFTLSVS